MGDRSIVDRAMRDFGCAAGRRWAALAPPAPPLAPTPEVPVPGYDLFGSGIRPSSLSNATLRHVKVEEIVKAIAKLPPDQLARFRRWFAAFEAGRVHTTAPVLARTSVDTGPPVVTLGCIPCRSAGYSSLE